MNRTDFFFSLCGLAVGALVAAAGWPEAFDKVFLGGAVVLVVTGFVSVTVVLHRSRGCHPDLYNEIGAANDDLSWGVGDAFGRFMKFLHSSRHQELNDILLSTAVTVGRASWHLSFFWAGIAMFFAFRSLAG